MGEFEKKLLHKLSIEVTDRFCNGIVRESSEGFFVPAILSEVCKPWICDRLICANYIPEAAPDPDIVVSKGSVSNDNTGGEGSGLGDVGNEVIADDDVA